MRETTHRIGVLRQNARKAAIFVKVGVAQNSPLINQGKGKGTNGTGDPDYYEWRRVR